MAQLGAIVDYLHELLSVDRYSDYCPNGLQVEGRAEVRLLVSGVTASQALLDAAVEAGADAILVHHGYFWRGEDARVVGMKRRRLGRLLGADVSLLAYHLPLDGHPEYGNNAQLGRILELEPAGSFGRDGLALWAALPAPVSATWLADRITAALGRVPMHIAGGGRPIRRLGWCSGAAQGYLEAAAAIGLDAFVSGEIDERTVHIARELGVHYFAAGHHASERFGVQALGGHLSDRFALTHRYIDVENPV